MTQQESPSQKTYDLRWNWAIFTMTWLAPAVIFAGGIGFLLVRDHTDQWVPPTVFPVFMCLAAGAMCVRSLLLPHRIIVRATGAIEFVARLRRVLLVPHEIVSIQPAPGQIGYLV